MSVTPTKPVGAVDALNAESPSTPSGAVTGDDVIPLLLAVNPGIVVNYKRMAALDPKHRTWSSWEHKFRKLKARGKELAGGAAGADDQSSKAAGDMEETVILLIAANPGISFDYRQIAALDLQGRTYYSWEHRFRKWRASAKELVEQSGEAAGGDGDVAPVKKAKRARAKVKQAAPINVINDDNGCDRMARTLWRKLTAARNAKRLPKTLRTVRRPKKREAAKRGLLGS